MCGLRSGHLKSIGQEPLCDHLDTDERHDQRGMPLCRCSKLYHCRSGSPGTCCIQILEPGRREFLPVLRGAEQRLAYVLSSLTRGREYDGFTPSQCSIASAVVAFSGAPYRRAAPVWPQGWQCFRRVPFGALSVRRDYSGIPKCLVWCRCPRRGFPLIEVLHS
jgi:hypothetical protein